MFGFLVIFYGMYTQLSPPKGALGGDILLLLTASLYSSQRKGTWPTMLPGTFRLPFPPRGNVKGKPLIRDQSGKTQNTKD